LQPALSGDGFILKAVSVAEDNDKIGKLRPIFLKVFFLDNILLNTR
jgi:hypothetical protein